ncbi:MAG: VacJ family lipoprotein [Pseudomonadota bacterium]
MTRIWPLVIRAGARLGLLLMCIGATGCAALGEGDYGSDVAVLDQAESFNRKSYQFTDAVDRNLVRPVARGYHRVMPDWLETGILNVFQNLRTVPSAVNGFLQGKPRAGMTDLGRLVINSTLGIGGFFDVAGRWNMPYQDEDFGQTLAVWGYERSRFVYVPFMGPTTLRDLPSLLVRSAMPRLILGDDYHIAISALDLVSVRAELLTATDVRDVSALDPYAFTRDAYYQRRKFLIHDGELVEDEFFDEFDDFEDESP